MRYLAVSIFCSLVAFSAWPVGGNLAHTRTVMILLALVALILAVIKHISRPDIKKTPLVWYVLAIGIGYAIFQITPFSQPLAEMVERSPSVSERVAEVSNNLSVYPAVARERICELLLGVSIFFAAACLLYRRNDIVTTMVVLAMTGVAISLFGIIQKLSSNGKVLWSYELLGGGLPFGPFVNKNNAGGFLLACFCAAIFLIAHQVFGWVSIHRPNGFSLREEEARGGLLRGGFLQSVFGLIAGLQTKHLYSIAAVVFITTGIVASLSRGAALGMLVAGFVSMVMVVLSNRKANQRSGKSTKGSVVTIAMMSVLILLVSAGAIGLTIWAEQTELVTTQLETLADPAAAGAPRLAHWKTSWPYVKENIGFGSGLGSYAYMYPLYHNEPTMNRWFRHAENVYIETLAEMGIAGVTLLLLAIVMLAIYSRRLLRKDSAFDRALGVAGFCCLIGQFVVCLFDFGIYQPPNIAAVATILGMVTARAFLRDPSERTDRPERTEQTDNPKRERTRKWAAPMATVLLLLILAGCIWAARESHAVECVRHSSRLIRLFNRYQGANPEYLDQSEWMLKRATAIRPDDSEAHFQMGELYVARYRQMTMEELVGEPSSDTSQTRTQETNDNTSPVTQASLLLTQDSEPTQNDAQRTSAQSSPETTTPQPNQDRPADGQPAAQANRTPTTEPAVPAQFLGLTEAQRLEQIWSATSVTSAHRLAHLAMRTDPAMVQELKLTDGFAQLEQAWASYQRSDEECSYLPKTQFRLAQLSILMEGDPQTESQRLEESLSRWPENYNLLFDCGLLYLNAGNGDQACQLWHNCLSLSRRFEEQIILFSTSDLTAKQFFEKVLLQDPENMIRIARRYFGEPNQALSQKMLLVHTGRLVQASQDMDTSKKHFLIGQINHLSKNYQAAADSYEKAVGLNPNQVLWRYSLALCLFELNDFQTAMKHLKVCELIPSEILPQVSRLIKRIERERVR